mmetsp:Transcript_29211/g.73308  ORF Transcript_29211/g.73308 Transcript_29211/m.73308 type:complete len:101 (-) Transcript_29211:22-324(-)
MSSVLFRLQSSYTLEEQDARGDLIVRIRLYTSMTTRDEACEDLPDMCGACARSRAHASGFGLCSRGRSEISLHVFARSEILRPCASGHNCSVPPDAFIAR